MLFMGEYYIAETDGNRKEVIETFLEDDNYKTLVIVDPVMRLHEYGCQIECLVSIEEIIDTKRIFMCAQLDGMAKAFVKQHWSLLAFF